MLETMGWISIVPVALAVILAFTTRNTIVSLATACIVGCFIAGKGIFGFTDLLKVSLGNEDFIWVVVINMMAGIMAAYFQKSGAIEGFTKIVEKKNLSRKAIQVVTWLLGCLIFFSDSFSPLFVGGVMRRLSDKAKISREKLAYICDSTSAPVAVFLPVTSWSAYLCGLAVGVGAIVTQTDAFNLFVKAMPFNFYAIFSIIFVALICCGVIPEYGPMKKAEKRALNEGKLIRDGAVPLMSVELTEMKQSDNVKPRVFLNFLLPIVMLLVISFGTFILTGSTKVMEALVFIVIFMSISLFFQGMRKDHIIYRDDLKCMKRNSMIVDVSCDRNGGIETSIPTTIENPTYVLDGVMHYVVDHTPALFHKTFTWNNSEVIWKYINELQSENYDEVLSDALIIKDGEIVDDEIRKFQGR